MAPSDTSEARVNRPWGWFEVIAAGGGFQVKLLAVGPGEATSLQSHARRSEHWVVLRGWASVRIGDDTRELGASRSAFVPRGAVHRISNPGVEPLEIIEVQLGEYLGEDDIVRHEDKYGRA